MIYDYKGHYSYDKNTITNWNNTSIGVYYCGVLSSAGKLSVYYVGKGTSSEGMRARLLDHLNISNLPGCTHFGYRVCGTKTEAENFEMKEIERLQPRYNQVGK